MPEDVKAASLASTFETEVKEVQRRHSSEMMDKIAKGPEDVKKSVSAADELP
jgi:FKBP-type peptidyl-prolyl cis-trans isomerase (trigger factor)